jgi:hypothetical protein
MSGDPVRAARAHMPELIQGTPDIRCGNCRFRYPKHGPAADAGMGICGRYRGSIALLTLGHSEACWHHQRARAKAQP